MTIETRTYEHTLPSGETLTFEVSPSKCTDGELCVTYPAGVDFSDWKASDAYPIAEIEADFGLRFDACTGYGEDHGTAWELWQVR